MSSSLLDPHFQNASSEGSLGATGLDAPGKAKRPSKDSTLTLLAQISSLNVMADPAQNDRLSFFQQLQIFRAYAWKIGQNSIVPLLFEDVDPGNPRAQQFPCFVATGKLIQSSSQELEMLDCIEALG